MNPTEQYKLLLVSRMNLVGTKEKMPTHIDEATNWIWEDIYRAKRTSELFEYAKFLEEIDNESV